MCFGRISNEKRKQLYDEVWKTPVRTLAKQEGISDVALRKRLINLAIPLPPRGYWAKSEKSRNAVPIPPLPDVTRPLSNLVFGYAIERVSRDDLADDQLAGDDPFLLITDQSKHLIEEFCETFTVEKQLRNPSIWVQQLEERISEWEKQEKESKDSYRYSYWHDNSREYVVPFNVSKANERRVLRILDTLDKRLYEIEGAIREGEKRIDSRNNLDWRFYIYVPLGEFSMLIKEKQRELTFSFFQDRSSTNTSLLICSGSKRKPVEEQIGEALYKLCVTAGKAANTRELEERHRERRAEVEAWQRAIKKAELLESEHRAILDNLIVNHASALQVRAFIASLDRTIEQTDNQNTKSLLEGIRAWAMGIADDRDPFVCSKGGQGIQDVWALASAIQNNRINKEELRASKPQYSAKELGEDPRRRLGAFR